MYLRKSHDIHLTENKHLVWSQRKLTQARVDFVCDKIAVEESSWHPLGAIAEINEAPVYVGLEVGRLCEILEEGNEPQHEQNAQQKGRPQSYYSVDVEHCPKLHIQGVLQLFKRPRAVKNAKWTDLSKIYISIVRLLYFSTFNRTTIGVLKERVQIEL